MSEHKHGSMDISHQKETFAGFVTGTIWIGGISIAAIIFLAIFNS